MTRFFRKSKKKLFWGHFWAKWIFLENDSVIFWIFQLSTTMQKTEKTNEPFLKKIPNWKTDRRTNGRQTDRRAGRQTDNGDLVGPSVWRGSKNYNIFLFKRERLIMKIGKLSMKRGEPENILSSIIPLELLQ